MKRRLYPVFFLYILCSLATAAKAQPPLGYLYVREIVINESQIPDGPNLVDFPFLVRITNPDFRSVANGGHVGTSRGHDILFYANGCATALSHQLDYYDPATGEIAAWVRIPVLSTTADSYVYMYYGNDTVSASTSVTGVWDAGYSAIWHLGDDPSSAAPQVRDATANNHNGSNVGGMTSANLVNGKIGKALSFDEVNDHVRIPDFLYGQELTVSFWFNLSEVNGNSYQYVFSHGTWSAPNSLNVYIGEDNITIPAEVKNRRMVKTVFRDNNDANNTDTLDAGNTLIDGNWHYYTCRMQDWGGAHIYIDGAEVVVYSVWGANVFDPTTDLFLGGREDLNAGRFYGGLLDEVRISSVWRTSNWIQTEYNNQNDPGSFSTMGIEGAAVSFCSILAAPLTSFTANRTGNGVKLQWSTGNINEQTRFTVERSLDGINWQAIGNTTNSNSFTDAFAPGCVLYYRLKKQSGTEPYISAVRKVEATASEVAIRAYPNPSYDGHFYIDFPGTEIPDQFALYDPAGVMVKQARVEKKYGNTYLLKLDGAVQKGIYLLRFRYKNSYQAKTLIIGQ